MDNLYTRLQLAPDASDAAIRKAYRKLAKTCHPDLHPGDAERTKQFIRLTEAYNTLSDPAARARYDEELLPPPQTEAEEHWPPRPSFGKNPGRQAPPPHTRRPDPLFHREDFLDIGMFLLAVLRSPITYCVLIAFLLLYGFKEMISGVGVHHKP